MRPLPRVAALFIVGSLSLAALAAPLALPQPVRQVEGITEYRLANGLQVLLIPDASKPTVTVNVTYHVGSRMEGYGESGMAHLLEHLMFNTTKLHANVGAELQARHAVQRQHQFGPHQLLRPFRRPGPALLGAKTEADRMTGAKVLQGLDTEMTVQAQRDGGR
jgi:zinc protease